MAPKTAAELVGAAKAHIENLSVDEVDKELADGVMLIDLREPDEIATTGRIAGSVHVPRGMLEFRADPTSPYHPPELDPARRVVLHCASGGRSALAAVALEQLGYANVAHLDGGFKAWTEGGRPVVR